MLTFALVVARKGLRLPAPVGAVLGDASLTEVPFRARRHLSWTSPSGAVAFGGWQHTGDDDPIGSRWHEADGGLTAFTGHVWPRSGPWRGEHSWAAGLAEHFRAHPPSEGTDELLGLFTAVSLAADGQGTVATDPLGLGLVYRAESPSMTVLASRASLVARLVTAETNVRPRRDALGAFWLAYSVHPMGLRTGYEGVEVLPPGAVVRIDPATGARLDEPARRPWRFASTPDCDPHDFIEQVQSDIATSIRAACAMPVANHIIDITGGKDSRLVLAVTLGEKLERAFTCRTSGAPDLPDVVAARHIAAAFDLPHGVNVVDPRGRSWRAKRNAAIERCGYAPPPDRETTMRLTVGTHLGMRNLCETHASCPPHGDSVVLSGLTGELLRTNFPPTTRHRVLDDLDTFFRVDLRYGMAGILRPEMRRHYDNEIWRMVFADLSTGDGPQDVIDSFYLRNRLRRWFGTFREVDEQNAVYPLYSPVGVRAAFEMGVTDRHNEFFHYEITRRSSPELFALPFAKGTWQEQKRVPWVRRTTPHEPIAPPPVPFPRAPNPFRGPGARGQERTARLDERTRMELGDIEIMRRYLVDDAPESLRDIIDPAGVTAALERFTELTEASKRQLYGALSAAIWLGEADINYRADDD